MDAQVGKELRIIYEKDPNTRAILDVMATYVYGVSGIKTHMMEQHLRNAGHELSHSQVVAAFRKLEQVGIGKYVEGRRGARSRFELVDRVTVIAKLIHEKNIENLDFAALDLEDESIEEMTTHTLLLRPNLNIEIQLPIDLTQREADRLARFASCLAMESD